MTWQPSDQEAARLSSALLIAPDRSFKQDPRFGMIVLSEIASRALSPGVNDPGTAIDVIGRLVRLLSAGLKNRDRDKEQVEFDNVHVPAIEAANFFEDVFNPVARDGAGNVEVGIRLQKALAPVPPRCSCRARLCHWRTHYARSDHRGFL